MTAPSPGFIDYITELLTPIGSVRSKRMFGGIGIYIDGLFCALVFGDALYFKSDEHNEAQYIAAGCPPFLYNKKGEDIETSYYLVPEEAMDNAEQMMHWARLGMAAALRKAAGPQKNTSRRKSKST